MLLALHLAAALVAPALVGRLGRRAFLVLALVPASAAVWALTWSERVQGGELPLEQVRYVPALGLELTFRLDTLAWLMTVVVGGVGALVLAYCSAYFKSSAAGLGRFAGVFLAFAGSMLGLVLADDMILLFVMWELTTVTSYLLIGHNADKKASRRAAMQAIVITTAGGLALLVGVVLLGEAAGTYRMSAVIADPPPPGALTTAAIACLLFGAVTKSALVPFHFWLPAAMAAPTPVSAYLHAAAMVKAGVYLVARFAPAFAADPVWRWSVAVLGSATLLVGGYRAMRQHDLKLVLAFGTVSQLGLLVLLVGLGTRAAALAGVALLGAHAMFKASLFLVTGIVDAATGTRDLRRLSGVGRALPWTATAGALATASMIGLPPFAGFVAKEAGLEALLHLEGGWEGPLLVVAVAVGSAFTVAYGLRFWWGAFASKPVVPEGTPAHAATAPASPLARTPDAAPVPDASHHRHAAAEVTRPSLTLLWPALVLAVLGLATALLPALGEHLLSPYADTLPTGEAGHLVLWAGLTPALGITAAVLTVGVLLFVARGPFEAFGARVSRGPDADLVYRRTMRRLDDLAADVTAITQRGSLPVYLGVVLVVFVAGTGVALLTGTSLDVATRPWDHPAQLPFAVAAGLSALLVARARRRLKAVVLLGVCGYAIAGLFVVQGAPDLALTQVLVETVTLVVFVLVLRRLPAYFSDRPLAASRWVRVALGVAAGVTVAGVALVAPSARVHAPVSENFAEEAYEFGGGRNVVNVTLVDIRAWDTVGEIAVLLVAATGVASLVFLQRRSGQIFRADEAPADRAVWGGSPDPTAALRRAGPRAAAAGLERRTEWLRSARTLAPQRRSVIFEVVVRLLFHTMVVFGLFLLFSGHNQPGGGFAAGLVVGTALVVRYLAGGRYELGEAAPVQPGVLLGLGLFLSAGVGLAALLAGGTVLQSWILETDVPLLGHVKVVTSLVFDIGVFLLVVGVVLDVLRSLGAELDRRAEAGEDEVADGSHAIGAVGSFVGAAGSELRGSFADASDGAGAAVPTAATPAATPAPRDRPEVGP
ncbi:multicomponent Na+:H+ antiporter subunit A [Cellulomonas marina]|uniref:Multicomponent Na+:H+ antiporter subunit A n=2 Tax=Cellulomonas marina TaxID=988821 RepID=A0A1I0YBT2_9CELL|nr:multicomponent Na+:H+ antiporter subunit A [Cellulomonas marina]